MIKKKITIVASIALAGILALSVLAAISITNQAFAQEKPTQLTLNVSPDTKGATSYSLTGKLTSDGIGLPGKDIILTSSKLNYMGKFGIAVTGPDGEYSFTTTKPLSIVSAWYTGNGEPEPLQYGISSAVRTLK
jgi:hypothetical protein